MGGDAHEAFEAGQRHLLVRAVRDILDDALPKVRHPEAAAEAIVSHLPVSFAWGLLGRRYANKGVTDQIYDHLEKICEDFDRMMVDAHGQEAAEATKLQAEMALRRFIVEHDLPRGDRPPAEVKEVEEVQEPERSRDPDSPESAAELGEAAVEAAEKVADEHLSGRPGLEPLDSVAKTSCVHHPDSEAVVQSAESGQPLCRPCARLVSASVETETELEEEHEPLRRELPDPSQNRTEDRERADRPDLNRYEVFITKGTTLWEHAGCSSHVCAASWEVRGDMVCFLSHEGEVYTSLHQDSIDGVVLAGRKVQE